MTPEKVLEAVMEYRRIFHALDVPPVAYPHDVHANNTYTNLAHAHYMLDQLEQYVKEGSMEKAFRWLGFIQAVMWAGKVFTITELKDHNKPDADGSTHTVS